MTYLPAQLLRSLQDAPGFDETSFKAVHETGDRITAVRFHPSKAFPGGAGDAHALYPELPLTTPVPWSEDGYYLRERPAFYLDPLWHAGAYYVQDASSMSLQFAFRQMSDPAAPLRILDLCAAPGGKSTLMAGMMSPGSLLVSNEVIGSRVGILRENMIKWGVPGVVVTGSDPRDFGRLPGFFDVVLIDAPCSGSGLFRKDPAAVGEWSAEQVAVCSQRQRRILRDALPSLKPGGLLMYATCSYSPEENEAITGWLGEEFQMESLSIPFPPEWGILESRPVPGRVGGYRFYPDKLAGEGFFLACLRKPGDPAGGEASGRQSRGRRPAVPVMAPREQKIWAPWIDGSAESAMILWGGSQVVTTDRVAADLDRLSGALRIVSVGCALGKVVRDQCIPDHALAMATVLDRGIPSVALDRGAAIRFLRKETPEFPEKARGWLLATYHGIGLGWLKGLGGRLNNYYPTAWRIRKSP